MKLSSLFIILSFASLFAKIPVYNEGATERMIALIGTNPFGVTKHPLFKQLILEGADPDARFVSKTTPLFYAVGDRDYELCELLIAHGANVNALNEGGATPLIWATFFEGNLEICKLLLKHGAQVQPVTHNLFPLMFAAMNGNKEICEFLITNGADINAMSCGTTALHIATGISVKYEEISLYLLSKGANVNARDANGATVLMTMAFDGKVKMCELFLAHGAEVNLKDNDGFTPLIVSCNANGVFSSHEKLAQVTKLLLAHGADVNAATHKGYTPLHLAACYGLIKTVELLLIHNADPSAKNNEGETPLALAIKYERDEVIQLLRAFKKPMNFAS